MTDKLTAEEILTRVFNDGFVMGELGMGDEKESVAIALSELAKVDKVCPECKGTGVNSKIYCIHCAKRREVWAGSDKGWVKCPACSCPACKGEVSSPKE